MTDEPAGWLDDPTGRHDHRYWDGTEWTEHVADAGVSSVDPYDEAPPAPGAAAVDDPSGDTPAPDAPATGPIGWAGSERSEPDPEPTPDAAESAPSLSGWAVPTRADGGAPSAPAAEGAAGTSSPADADPEPDPAPEPGSDAEPTLAWTPQPRAETPPTAPDAPLPSAWAVTGDTGGRSASANPSAADPGLDPEPEPTPEAGAGAETLVVPAETTWAPASSAEPLAASERAPTQVTAAADPTPRPDRYDDGPERPGRRKAALLLLGLLLIGGVVAAVLLLGGNDDDGGGDDAPSNASSPAAQGLATQFRDQLDGLSQEQADCLAEGIVDAVGEERASDLDVTGTPPADIADQVADALTGGLESCDIDQDALTPADDGDDAASGINATSDDIDSSGDSSTDATTKGSVASSIPSEDELQAFEDIYANGFRDSYGLSEEESRCLAKALTDAVREGRAVEEEANDEFFTYLDACGIDQSRLETPAG